MQLHILSYIIKYFMHDESITKLILILIYLIYVFNILYSYIANYFYWQWIQNLEKVKYKYY